MRISAKGRYALAAMIYMAARYENGENISVINISESLGISKIYLEQIFTVLKNRGLVRSVKGAAGGYVLTASPKELTAYDILLAVEPSLFEAVAATVQGSAPHIESAMQALVFGKIDERLKGELNAVTLLKLAENAEFNKNPDYNMFYI
ncbi:MAG: Rrf2 family transcriptional regulator [Clostridia bacterium]